MAILIIEDHPVLGPNYREMLQLSGFSAELESNGKKGLESALTQSWDLLIVDLNLPDMNGLTICQRLRKHNPTIPILILTAHNDIANKIHGFEVGADDYLAKPFDSRELILRIKALLKRRSTPESKSSKPLTELPESVTVDIESGRVFKGDKAVSLAPKEWSILKYLLDQRGHPQNQVQILEAVWGPEAQTLEMNSETVMVHIAYLRKKLGSSVILTSRNHGYLVA